MRLCQPAAGGGRRIPSEVTADQGNEANISGDFGPSRMVHSGRPHNFHFLATETLGTHVKPSDPLRDWHTVSEVRVFDTVSKPLFILSIVMMSLLPMSVMAQDVSPVGPPLVMTAAQLDVSEGALKNCMPRPEPGTRAERPDAASIATCLQADEPIVTAQVVSDITEANAPTMKRHSN